MWNLRFQRTEHRHFGLGTFLRHRMTSPLAHVVLWDVQSVVFPHNVIYTASTLVGQGGVYSSMTYHAVSQLTPNLSSVYTNSFIVA